MNTEEKIIKLREEGKGYKIIAKIVGKSRDYVRNLCLKNSLGGVRAQRIKKEKVLPVIVCTICGTIIHGRKAKRCKKCKDKAVCLNCGIVFTRNKNVFCCHKCKVGYYVQNEKDKVLNKVCQFCGSTFFSLQSKSQYCSADCRAASKRTLKNTVRECVVCSTKYEPKNNEQQCCGTECAKIKETQTKRAQGARILTEEEYAEKRRYGWKYQEWRKSVYGKDKYICQCCGEKKGGSLNAHHVESYSDNPDKRYELKNGITLCQYCHREFHLAFGFGNNTREQLLDFLLQRKGVGTWLKQADHQSQQLCTS